MKKNRTQAAVLEKKNAAATAVITAEGEPLAAAVVEAETEANPTTGAVDADEKHGHGQTGEGAKDSSEKKLEMTAAEAVAGYDESSSMLETPAEVRRESRHAVV